MSAYTILSRRAKLAEPGRVLRQKFTPSQDHNVHMKGSGSVMDFPCRSNPKAASSPFPPPKAMLPTQPLQGSSIDRHVNPPPPTHSRGLAPRSCTLTATLISRGS
ncbi:hypothetical protein IG631_21925 [Alternaria alternata]|nr:hypothetical protein IG631_21925 [Alternaria alternata]